MQAIQGIHHITAFASDPQKNASFYHTILGQRLVKTTVNFDDPGTYHLYYGDKVGTPGTIMTYFPWVGARKGRPGNGEVATVSYSIGLNSVEYWQNRLTEYGLNVTEKSDRFGNQVLGFHDPDGMDLELIANDDEGEIQYWDSGDVPEEHAIRGFHSVTLWVSDATKTSKLLTEIMGYELVGTEDNRHRFKGASQDIGLYVDLLVRPNQPRGIPGAGSVHHVAFRTRDDSEQLEYQQLLHESGFGVTEVKDRQYFHSIYFREPSGVLFEVATDAPGFAIDESVEELGTHLKLPPWLEPQREVIENVLPKFSVEAVKSE